MCMSIEALRMMHSCILCFLNKEKIGSSGGRSSFRFGQLVVFRWRTKHNKRSRCNYGSKSLCR